MHDHGSFGNPFLVRKVWNQAKPENTVRISWNKRGQRRTTGNRNNFQSNKYAHHKHIYLEPYQNLQTVLKRYQTVTIELLHSDSQQNLILKLCYQCYQAISQNIQLNSNLSHWQSYDTIIVLYPYRLDTVTMLYHIVTTQLPLATIYCYGTVTIP